jgi:hypothetical protein
MSRKKPNAGTGLPEPVDDHDRKLPTTAERPADTTTCYPEQSVVEPCRPGSAVILEVAYPAGMPKR